MKYRFNLLGKFHSKVTGSDEPQIAGEDHNRYAEDFCLFMNQIDPNARCLEGCKWIAPYGWVPNASCPLHD